METKSFKTRTIMQEKANPVRSKEIWPVAIDMGYSAVKGMSANALFCFPSYARKLAKNAITLTQPESTDILYRDTNNGDIYAVGLKAESMISIESTNDSTATLYGRNRYFSDNFRITSRAALGLGMMENQYGSPEGKRIVLQTGLPPRYMDDASLLNEAFAGDYDFELKVGSSDWKHFTFSINASDIFITQQPMGSMVSVATDINGRPTSDSEKLFKSNMLVFDPGFRTGDSCLIKRGTIDPDDCQTFDDLSMIAILQKTVEDIGDRYGTNINVPAIQPFLESGYVKSFDRKSLKSSKIDFSDILEAKNKEVCEHAINRLCEVYNYFQEIDYLVLTGGTGAAWSNIIRDRLKDLETLTILSGNRNDDLPHIFSNVRGYYMYLINKVR